MIPIITLTTDFGTKDYFVGALKGRIYSELPNAKVVDLSHKITPFSVNEAAYVIRNAYTHFPKGSIHIIAVDSEQTIENKHIAISLDGHYFICADNGVVSLIRSNFNPDKVVEIYLPNSKTDYFLSNFVKVACHIARGGSLQVIGMDIIDIKSIKEVRPFVNAERNQIIGYIIYIDNYGNAITNIDKAIFNAIGKGRKFEIKTRFYTFDTIFSTYSDVVNFDIPIEKRNYDGKKMILFNSDDFLEVALYRSNNDTVGGASSMLSLGYRDTVTINFL